MFSFNIFQKAKQRLFLQKKHQTSYSKTHDANNVYVFIAKTHIFHTTVML